MFTILLMWLMTVVKDVPKEEWYKTGLAYDNMCHLDALQIARKPLPPYNNMWLSITKACIAYFTLRKLLACYICTLVIDELHFKNHIDKACREHDPSVIKDKHPGMISFMSAEQTFTWLSPFRKILCGMPKIHHLFYLHCITKKRN